MELVVEEPIVNTRSQEIARLQKVHHRIHVSPFIGRLPFMSQMNPVHIRTTHFALCESFQ